MLRKMSQEGKKGKGGEDDEEPTKDEPVAEADKADPSKPSKYIEFWKQFGKNIKLGVIEDSANRSKLAKVSEPHGGEWAPVPTIVFPAFECQIHTHFPQITWVHGS